MLISYNKVVSVWPYAMLMAEPCYHMKTPRNKSVNNVYTNFKWFLTTWQQTENNISVFAQTACVKKREIFFECSSQYVSWPLVCIAVWLMYVIWLLNSKRRIMHLKPPDWFTESRLPANIIMFNRIWKNGCSDVLSCREKMAKSKLSIALVQGIKGHATDSVGPPTKCHIYSTT